MSGTCPATGKQRHRTETAAGRVARVIQGKGSQGAHAYHCSACHSWHVGSGHAVRPAKPQAFRRARREVPPTPPGMIHCQRAGCGHPATVHVGEACLGARGACQCAGLEAAP